MLTELAARLSPCIQLIHCSKVTTGKDFRLLRLCTVDGLERTLTVQLSQIDGSRDH